MGGVAGSRDLSRAVRALPWLGITLRSLYRRIEGASCRLQDGRDTPSHREVEAYHEAKGGADPGLRAAGPEPIRSSARWQALPDQAAGPVLAGPGTAQGASQLLRPVARAQHLFVEAPGTLGEEPGDPGAGRHQPRS